jgi:hypothetical protein
VSHVVSVDIRVRDLDALEAAAKVCGFELRRGQRTYKWFGESVGDYPIPEGLTADQLGHCDHALALVGDRDAYEVGLIAQADGSFRLVFDFWGPGRALLAALGGEKADRLMAEYTMQAAERRCSELGWMTTRDGAQLRVYHPSGGELVVSTAGEVEALGFQGVGCADATRAISEALGVEVGSSVKPEYNLCQQTIKRGE